MTPSIPLQQTAGLITPCGMNCAYYFAIQRQKKRCPGYRKEDPNKSSSCQVCIIRNSPTILNNNSFGLRLNTRKTLATCIIGWMVCIESTGPLNMIM
ncbi:hypothetical protein ACKUB1_11520 [Methanospirillum stamsii]|uniref:Uncharacterized protein n=1 Tax=Methanospirillum stamsii TaxID=1277351 RepID=A0A2V2N6N6_9EURY|nr:hypothetical protein DLD82_12830 [Methanospirillum stamsii]